MKFFKFRIGVRIYAYNIIINNTTYNVVFYTVYGVLTDTEIQLVKEEDIVVNKDLFLINTETGLTKGLYVNEAGTNTFMLIGNNMKSVSTDRGNNWTTSTLGEYTLTDLIYVDSNWYAIGSNGTKRLLLQNTASTFDQSNKILDLPDYSGQVIKINT